MKRFLTLLAAAVLAGCASTSATRLSHNEVLISTSAAPACRGSGAMQVASRMAAVETLRNGFERFVIVAAGSTNNVRATSMPPTGAFTTGTFNTMGGTTYSTATTNFTGGGPMIYGTHDSALRVLMINRGEPGFERGVDARAALGPDWEKRVKEGIRTCR